MPLILDNLSQLTVTMKLTTSFLSLPLLLSSVLAPALAVSVPSSALSKRADNITAPYYLKTKTLDRRHRSKDGLYVWAYHTGTAPPLLCSPHSPPFPPFPTLPSPFSLPFPLHSPYHQVPILPTTQPPNPYLPTQKQDPTPY